MSFFLRALQSIAVSRWPYALQWLKTIMASATTRPLACSLFGNGQIARGEPRGKVEVISLIECVDDITYRCHLSRVKVMEYEFISARAGIFHLPNDEIRKMNVCLKHRNNLGKYWRPLKTCQYPQHKGRKTTLHCENPVNWSMAQELQEVFSAPVPVGSLKLCFPQFRCDIFTLILLNIVISPLVSIIVVKIKSMFVLLS